MNGKTIAIVSHLTLIGWIIAFVVNRDKKDPLASFYNRQVLGIFILGLAFSILSTIIGKIALIGSLAVFVLWIISIINAAGEKMAPLPVVGPLFQDWFKSL